MKKILVRLLVRLIPSSRFFRLKSRIWRFAGYGVSDSARLLSSVKIIGNITVEIGDHTFIGHESLLTGGDSIIKIGANCDISSRVIIIGGTHIINTPADDRMAGKGLSLDIKIGDGVWIGAGSIILPGVEIGEKTIIGAGSLVNRNMPSQSICAGNPCRVIKKFNKETKSWITVK